MFELLGISAWNPMLLWGSLAIASPILIHLLNRRRFKVVAWAAMEYLLEANRKNRKRLQMENLLLLLLRCLAVLLLALLVSRLFVTPTGAAAFIGRNASVERVVLLDDSPSMGMQLGASQAVFDKAKERLTRFVQSLGETRQGDTFTLLLTSDPGRPLVNGQPIQAAAVDELLAVIDAAEPSDVAADMPAVLDEVSRLVESEAGAVNRLVYVVTDMRQRDWLSAAAGADAASTEAASEPSPVEGEETTGADSTPRGEIGVADRLRRLADITQGVILMDVGGEPGPNLTVESLRVLDKSLTVDVPISIEAVVRNQGVVEIEEAVLTLRADAGVPQRRTVSELAPGEATSVTFPFTFRSLGPITFQLEAPADTLAIDNVRRFAGQVTTGVPVLLVDGSPSPRPRDNATFFLELALAPPRGDDGAASGNQVQVMGETQFETTELDAFETIYLCNVSQISFERAAELKQWVADGGGLVIFAGDLVDASAYNDRLFFNRELYPESEGEGLLPAQLVAVTGDDTQRRWVQFFPEAPNHPMMSVFVDASNALVRDARFFKWWTTIPAEGGRPGSVLASFTDADASPAVVERAYGDGRVVMVTTTTDPYWSNWGASPSFLVAMMELNSDLAPRSADEANFRVGQPIRFAFEPTDYELGVRYVKPDDEPIETMARATRRLDETGPATRDEGGPTDDGSIEPDGDNLEGVAGSTPTPGSAEAVPAVVGSGTFVATLEETGSVGFYQLELNDREGGTDRRVFAANIDPTEGDLTPVNRDELERRLGEANVTILEDETMLATAGVGQRLELWRPLLIAMVLILAAEQILAWWFGKRR